jgi:hypothetical protein
MALVGVDDLAVQNHGEVPSARAFSSAPGSPCAYSAGTSITSARYRYEVAINGPNPASSPGMQRLSQNHASPKSVRR